VPCPWTLCMEEYNMTQEPLKQLWRTCCSGHAECGISNWQNICHACHMCWSRHVGVCTSITFKFAAYQITLWSLDLISLPQNTCSFTCHVEAVSWQKILFLTLKQTAEAFWTVHNTESSDPVPPCYKFYKTNDCVVLQACLTWFSKMTGIQYFEVGTLGAYVSHNFVC